jgi:hypothetical protein
MKNMLIYAYITRMYTIQMRSSPRSYPSPGHQARYPHGIHKSSSRRAESEINVDSTCVDFGFGSTTWWSTNIVLISSLKSRTRIGSRRRPHLYHAARSLSNKYIVYIQLRVLSFLPFLKMLKLTTAMSASYFTNIWYNVGTSIIYYCKKIGNRRSQISNVEEFLIKIRK